MTAGLPDIECNVILNSTLPIIKPFKTGDHKANSETGLHAATNCYRHELSAKNTPVSYDIAFSYV